MVGDALAVVIEDGMEIPVLDCWAGGHADHRAALHLRSYLAQHAIIPGYGCAEGGSAGTSYEFATDQSSHGSLLAVDCGLAAWPSIVRLEGIPLEAPEPYISVMKSGLLAALSLLFLIPSCAAPTPDSEQAQQLVGTWTSTKDPAIRVTYRQDGTWRSVMTLEVEGKERQFRGNGTWKVQAGVLHNTTIEHDAIPGMEGPALPYLSKEKLLAVGKTEYQYVCPVQGCSNTMRRVDE